MSSDRQRKCSTMSVFKRQIENNPQYKYNRKRIEELTRNFQEEGLRRRISMVEIPVVVHVVYNEENQNIKMNQITKQISILNQDFGKTNDNIVELSYDYYDRCVDTKIRFALAVRDPHGNATNGVTRTRTDVSEFSDDDAVKSGSSGGKDPWPSDSYLNVWVCPLSDGLLGYAQFPGMDPETDGVVITTDAFGSGGTARPPFHLGRTTTHEIGHWLNLLHIWGDDGNGCTRSDNVSDTPNQAGYNTGEPRYPKITCSNGPHGDMFMNYMDYSDDKVMCMFTKGQSNRMRATLEGPRASILNSEGLNPTSRVAERTLKEDKTDDGSEFFDGVEWVKANQ